MRLSTVILVLCQLFGSTNNLVFSDKLEKRQGPWDQTSTLITVTVVIMAQFIRRNNNNIDVISSTSRPVSSASLQECVETSSSSDLIVQTNNSPTTDNFQTVRIEDHEINPSLPSLIYDNYTLMQPKEKQQIINEPLTSPELNSQSFQSALDTYHQPLTTGDMTAIGDYELETQQVPDDELAGHVNTIHEQDSAQTITAPVTQNQINPMVTVTILSRLFKFVKYLIGLDPPTNQDPERRPLLSPDVENQQPPPTTPGQGPAYNLLSRYRYFFIVLTILIGIGLITVVLATGDSKLLVLVFKAFLCYLLGSNAQYLFGQDFCPVS